MILLENCGLKWKSHEPSRTKIHLQKKIKFCWGYEFYSEDYNFSVKSAKKIFK